MSLLATKQDVSSQRIGDAAQPDSDDRHREGEQSLVSIHDEDGYFLSASKSVADILGYDLDELVGKNLRDLIPEQDIETHLSEGADNSLPQRPIQCRLEKSNGEYLEVETSYELYGCIEDERRYALSIRVIEESDGESRVPPVVDFDEPISTSADTVHSVEPGEIFNRLLTNLSSLVESREGTILLNPALTENFPLLREADNCTLAVPGAIDADVWNRYERMVQSKSMLLGAPGEQTWCVIPVEYGNDILAGIYFSGIDRSEIEKFKPLVESFASQTSTALECLELFDRYQKQARKDDLTSAWRRKYFFERAEREFESARRYDYPLTAVMIDIDHFKAVNDKYGHQVGDKALKCIVDRLQNRLRDVDLLGRYGGEEFVVLLPHTSLGVAYAKIAERLRRAVADHPVWLSDNKKLWLTISLGVASLDRRSMTVKSLIGRADQALFKAKEEGRNQVCFDSQSGPIDDARDSEFDIDHSKVVNFVDY